MNSRITQAAIASVFLAVAVLSMINTARFNNYVRDTLRRDTTQEQCIASTVNFLTAFLQARVNTEDAYDARDEALRGVVEGAAAGARVTREQADEVLADIDKARQARAALQDAVRNHPLTPCPVK
jgi:hypothetical protein